MQLFDQPSAGPLAKGGLMRCLKRDVGQATGSKDWREVQANRGMAALLMPRADSHARRVVLQSNGRRRKADGLMALVVCGVNAASPGCGWSESYLPRSEGTFTSPTRHPQPSLAKARG